MSSPQPQREFVSDQLTPGDEEFEEVIVKSEEEIDDQPSLPDFTRRGIKMGASMLKFCAFSLYSEVVFSRFSLKVGARVATPRSASNMAARKNIIVKVACMKYSHF
ncbi:hypothetical protein XENORESO_013761 [Xenotaenia resolanae]|uniref:Uncharacterized protein n=1 Tax=Xenotaenia resolanae TaxID=208358 RepID=A0ABV0WEK7_9TELE